MCVIVCAYLFDVLGLWVWDSGALGFGLWGFGLWVLWFGVMVFVVDV